MDFPLDVYGFFLFLFLMLTLQHFGGLQLA